MKSVMMEQFKDLEVGERFVLVFEEAGEQRKGYATSGVVRKKRPDGRSGFEANAWSEEMDPESLVMKLT